MGHGLHAEADPALPCTGGGNSLMYYDAQQLKPLGSLYNTYTATGVSTYSAAGEKAAASEWDVLCGHCPALPANGSVEEQVGIGQACAGAAWLGWGGGHERGQAACMAAGRGSC